MKTNFFVEFHGKQYTDKEILAAVKKSWCEAGNKLGDIKTMNMYIKPEEDTAYYVINELTHGKIELCK